MMRKSLLAISLSLIVSGCVTVRDIRTCTVAGDLSAGGICSHTLSSQTEDLNFDEFLDFLEAQPELPGKFAHGAAVCMSAADFNEMKTELEQACRELGKRCSLQTQQLLQSLP